MDYSVNYLISRKKSQYFAYTLYERNHGWIQYLIIISGIIWKLKGNNGTKERKLMYFT